MRRLLSIGLALAVTTLAPLAAAEMGAPDAATGKPGPKEGWGFLAQPWMITKLACVIFLSGWHGFLSGSRRRIAAGERPKSAKFWRATNEIPFIVAIIAILAVTLQFGQR